MTGLLLEATCTLEVVTPAEDSSELEAEVSVEADPTEPLPQ